MGPAGPIKSPPGFAPIRCPRMDAPPLLLAQSHWLANPNVQLSILECVKLLFVFAFGACMGSLMNVLVYRIPLGLDYVRPTSRCPSCETKLTANENIPILGWLLLRGKCRFCRTKISPEYPLVEFGMALLWAFTFALLYVDYSSVVSFLQPLQPEWGINGFIETWPLFIVVVMLMSFLFGMTLVDAKTFTIPHQFTTFPLLVGLAGHVGWALWVQYGQGRPALSIRAPDALWSIPAPGIYDWPMIGAALGGVLGVAIANLLLWKGVLTQSFGSEYNAWEEQARTAEAARLQSAATPAGDASAVPLDQQDYWQAYPHARKEMLREISFLAPAIGLAGGGAWLAMKLTGPWIYNPATLRNEPSVEAPLWLCVLAGCLLGYLIGAGVVWLMRILGSLLFGKEALGLGDVHMMGAVGVCLGWIDPVLAFFGAAFLGMLGFGIGKVFFRNTKAVLPYGPYLALGTMLVFFAKPAFEWAATALMAAQPPINLP